MCPCQSKPACTTRGGPVSRGGLGPIRAFQPLRRHGRVDTMRAPLAVRTRYPPCNPSTRIRPASTPGFFPLHRLAAPSHRSVVTGRRPSHLRQQPVSVGLGLRRRPRHPRRVAGTPFRARSSSVFSRDFPDVGMITSDNQWKTFVFMGYGLRSDRNLRRCPATARALADIPGLRTAFSRSWSQASAFRCTPVPTTGYCDCIWAWSCRTRRAVLDRGRRPALQLARGPGSGVRRSVSPPGP